MGGTHGGVLTPLSCLSCLDCLDSSHKQKAVQKGWILSRCGSKILSNPKKNERGFRGTASLKTKNYKNLY